MLLSLNAAVYCEFLLPDFRPRFFTEFFNLKKTFNLNDEQYERLMKEGYTPETLLAYEETSVASETINKWIDEHNLTRAPLYCVDKYGRENYVQKWTYSMILEEMYKIDFDFAVEDSPSAFDHLLHLKKCRIAVLIVRGIKILNCIVKILFAAKDGKK